VSQIMLTYTRARIGMQACRLAGGLLCMCFGGFTKPPHTAQVYQICSLNASIVAHNTTEHVV
jgi:hypothetical protein